MFDASKIPPAIAQELLDYLRIVANLLMFFTQRNFGAIFRKIDGGTDA
jgi:hypothetical protein